MHHRASKRTYTLQGLSYWLDRLGEDWEVLFSGQEIARGRKIYREGQVRELEFREGSAVMRCVTEGEDGYAVVDGQERPLHVRFSVEEEDLGRSMAVAGLYELEEVLGEEAPYLLSEDFIPKPKPPEEEEEPEEPEIEIIETGRTLGLSLRLEKERELEVRIHFDGVHFKSQDADEDALNNKERSDLVRITTQAMRAGFQYSRRREAFFLNDVEKLLNFFQIHYPLWKKRYPLDLGEGVKQLVRKPANTEITAIAEKVDGNEIALQWKYKAGARLLSEEEMSMLLKGRREVAIIPGKGFVRLSEERRKNYQQWKESENAFSGGQLPAYMLYSVAGANDTKIQPDAKAQKWQDSLDQELGSGRNGKGLLPILRPYQREGVRWLQRILKMGCHGLLADEMGLGKTLQILSLINSLPKSKEPALVVCPASVISVWHNEVDKFFPKMSIAMLQSGNDFSSVSKQPDLWVSSYSQIRRHKHLLKDAKFSLVILDEAQNIKNHDTKVTQACFNIQGKYRLVLSGTPIENTPVDLWTLFRFLMPGLLGSRNAFLEMLKNEPDTFTETLKTQIRPFILRRTKKLVAKDLPDKMEMVLRCPMSEEQRSTYNQLLQQGVEEIGNDVQEAMSQHSMSFLALLTRLRQVCVDPCLLPSKLNGSEDLSPESGKVQEFLRRMDELLERGHKVVVFSQFVGFLKALKPILEKEHPKSKVFELTGATKERGKLVKSFQSRKGSAIFLVSLRAGGTGITLHAADYVFLMDPWWNPAVEKQAIDRVHRIGQTKTVFVYRMIASGSIEERIQDLQQQKETTFAELIGNLEGQLLKQDDAFQNLRKLLELQ